MKDKELTFRFHDGSTRTVIVKAPECIRRKKANRPRQSIKKFRKCRIKTWYISEFLFGKELWTAVLQNFRIPKGPNHATLIVLEAHFKKEPPDIKPEIDFHHHRINQHRMDGNEYYTCPSPYKETLAEIEMKATTDKLKEAYDEGYKVGQHELNDELLRLGLLRKPEWIEGELAK